MKKRWDMSDELGLGAYSESIVCPIDGAEMVLVPAGEFIMGITEEELLQIFKLDQRQNLVFATELPARTVHLDSNYIKILRHSFPRGASPAVL